MTSSATQAIVAALTGLALLVAVVHLCRRGRLSFRYTLGWMAVASLGILGILLFPLAAPLADRLAISPAALLTLTALVLFLAITVQLSISITGLQNQKRKLTEEVARLRHEIHKLHRDCD